jgi:REP element-mobilizing transposase RayT
MGMCLAEPDLMLTPRRFQKDIRFFHANSGLNPLVWEHTTMPERWKLFCTALRTTQNTQEFTVHALVVMGTHFHLLFSTSAPSESMILAEFHHILTDLCNKTHEALEMPLYYESIPSVEYYKNAYKYIYRNPLEAGLCLRVEEYRYSSLAELLGRELHQSPVIDNMGLIHSPSKILDWLNSESAELKPKFESPLRY